MLPQIRQAPWYMGQMGVRGSDVQRGLRWEPTGIVLYVDPDSNNDTDQADGTDPENPMTTIQAAVTKLIAHQTAMGCSLSGSVIVLGGMAYTEAVTIPPAAPNYCTIVGASRSSHRPTWASDAGASPCLTVQTEGWTIEGIEFNCPDTSAGIRVEEVPASSISAYKTIIRDCVFDGLWSGAYGVEFYGAPHRVQILNNWFLEIDDWCITVTNSAHTLPYECAIIGNRFTESENFIGGPANRGFNNTLIQGNVLEEGYLLSPTIYIDMRGGHDNTVTGNFFGGTYTNAGGYYAAAGTSNVAWTGNVASVGPATVGDNGITVAVP